MGALHDTQIRTGALHLSAHISKPGMIQQALNDFNINLKASIMVGDKKSDIIEMDDLKSVLIQGKYNLDKCPSHVKIYSKFSDLSNFLINAIMAQTKI